MSELINDQNSGVEALNGFSFQRNSAIYILLDKYDVLVGKDFFVCIEHHDDVIFAHVDDSNQINKIEAYQAKKSTSTWSLGSKLAKIVAKMTLVGRDLAEDLIIKSSSYSHDLTFLTNKSITLNCGAKKDPKFTEIIRENNFHVFYTNLHSNIKSNFVKKLGGFSFESGQLANVSFKYIDVANTDKAQKDQLTGMLTRLFKDKISDSEAALSLIIKLFSEIETIYNQNNKSRLLDVSKRIQSKDIFTAIDIICNKSKAYRFWRENAQILSVALQIPLSKSRNHQEYLNDCFDYFKDLKQVEFQKIYRFVDENRAVDDACFTDHECIKKLYDLFLKSNQTQLDRSFLSFAIIAAYVETRNKINANQI